MTTRVLNVEKLEKKFASLTRSRDSIQNLSLWIIKHKEFYKEIVNQWLDALKKEFNALTMFYVANDVIQNCGRKKAPEFRDAFATVLENAVSLEKVKEIKNDVHRMLTLWHDRAIYDDLFFKKLENKLNAEASPKSDVEAELSEAEVISNFKLENLTNALRKVKTLKDELYEKESILDGLDEPLLSNIDNIIVKMETQKELRKCDKYQRLIEDYVSLLKRVIAAKKSLLLELKYSTIFYNAQHEDAKKVAHAYRIYGKKIKLLEKSLVEKLPTLPHESPIEVSNSPQSPDLEFLLSPNSNSMSISSFEYSNSTKENNEGYISDICISPDISNDCIIESVSKDKKLEGVVEKETRISHLDHLLSKGEVKSLELDQSAVETPHSLTKNSTESSAEIPESSSVVEIDKDVLENQSDEKVQTVPDDDCVDFLLEKAYDEQVKSKTNFKRKIDNLLKQQQSKVCKASSDDEIKSPMDTVESVPVTNVSNSEIESATSILTEQNNPEDDADEVASPISFQEAVDIKLNVSEDNESKVDENEDVIVCSQLDKSIQDVDVSNSSNNNPESETNSETNSFMFQTLPDIPTELLKTILDKHRVNMSLSSSTDVNDSVNEVVPEYPVENDLNSSCTESNSAMETENAVTSEPVMSESLKNDNSVKDDSEPSLVEKDKKDIPKDKLNSSCFLNALENILDYFANGSSYDKVEYSESFKQFQPMPFENTLRIYNCLMQNNDNSSEELSNRSFKEKSEIQTNGPHALVHNAAVVEHSNINKVSDNFPFISKQDNFEVMDMEVDSDDD